MIARYIFLMFAGLTTAAAAAPTIISVSVTKEAPSLINVTFDPDPEVGQVQPRSKWVLYVTTPTGTQKIDVTDVDITTFTEDHTIKLTVDPVVSEEATALDVSYIGDAGVVHATTVSLFGATPAGGKVTGATQDDADIYVKGSYTAVQNGDPVYDIDSFAGYMRALQVGRKKNYLGRFGAYGQIKTKQSSKADPDSFLAYLVYQRHMGKGARMVGPFSLPYFNYRIVGWEFDRSGKQLNFVTSPVLTVPMRLSRRLNGELEPGLSIPHMTFQMGTEFVNVRSSPAATVGGWHTRGLLGATFSTGYAPKTTAFYSIQLTSGYQVRLPSAREIFYDDKFALIDPTTGKKGDAPPMLGTQARHTLDTKLTYSFVKWAGVTFEHTYGSLPPLFNKTGNTFEFGLSLTLKQTSYGRYSILKP